MDGFVNNSYRWCVVETCKNTSIKTPEKLFIAVPSNTERRQEWLKLARLSTRMSGILYFCQDHFDLKDDLENYEEIKSMGSAAQVKMKETCVPSKIVLKRRKKQKGHRFTKIKTHVSANKIRSENVATESQSSTVGIKRTGPPTSYSVAKIRKTSRMENIVKVKSTRCAMCFSCDRNLNPLKEIGFLSKLVSEIQIFRRRILEAQALIAEAIDGVNITNKHGLSRLKTTDIEVVDNNIFKMKNIMNIRIEHNYMLPVKYNPICNNYIVVKREPNNSDEHAKIKNEMYGCGIEFENDAEDDVIDENVLNNDCIGIKNKSNGTQHTRIESELDYCQVNIDNKLDTDVYDFENLKNRVNAEDENELDQCDIKIENEMDDGVETKSNDSQNARITELNEESLENEAEYDDVDIKDELYDEYDIIENELLQYENMHIKSELNNTVPIENECKRIAETVEKDSARDVSNTERVNYGSIVYDGRNSCSSDEVTDSASEFEMEMDGAVFLPQNTFAVTKDEKTSDTSVPESLLKENCNELFPIKVEDERGNMCPCASINPQMDQLNVKPNSRSCPDCNRSFDSYKGYVSHQRFALKHVLKGCSQEFEDSYSMVNSKRFCFICMQKFRSEHSLARHVIKCMIDSQN